VEAEDFPFEGFQAAGGGLNQKEMLAGGFDFSFPAVNRFDWGGVDVDAGGEVFLEEGAGDFAGFGEGGAGYQDEAELGGHGFLGDIVVDLQQEESLTQRRRGRREEEDREEEVLWRLIVRAHPLQKAQRVGHPQGPVLCDVRQRRDCGRMWGLWLLLRWCHRLSLGLADGGD